MKKCLLSLLVLVSIWCKAQDTTIVYFDFDKYDITDKALTALDKILAKKNLANAVIYGHTDQLGSTAYNDQLSVKRATAIKNYFVASGISEEKITVVQGFGKTMPVINKLDASSRQANRRVIIITQYEAPKVPVIVTEPPKKQEPAAPIQQETPKAETPPAPREPVRKTIKEDLITAIADTATRAGDNIVLNNINFFGGRHVFLPQAYAPLEELLQVMQTFPTLEIEIQGHICCQAGDGDGLDIDTNEPFLSFNRAKAVYQYLVDKGIDRKRMKYKGYGHKFPIIATEKNEAERTTNRRVEIKILKK